MVMEKRIAPRADDRTETPPKARAARFDVPVASEITLTAYACPFR
jgi:hypothetical protein